MGSFVINIDQFDKNHSVSRPTLVMKYKAYGLFLTKGWDPLSDNPTEVQEQIAKAKGYLVAPPPVPPYKLPAAYPAIFFIFGKRDDVKD